MIHLSDMRSHLEEALHRLETKEIKKTLNVDEVSYEMRSFYRFYGGVCNNNRWVKKYEKYRRD